VISAADVEKILAHTRSESAFTLFSAIAEGNFSKSLEIIRSLLSGGESSIAIFAGLTWCFRRFRDYCNAVSENRAGDFELKKIGISTLKSKTDYKRALENYGLSSGDTLLALCAKYDLETRTSGMTLESLVFDLFLYEINKLKSKHL
jgi:DNA polymerase-3 subunit delta